MVGIYKITSPSGKVYVGQSRDIGRRISEYRTLHCKKQVKLYNSLLKYGWEAHKFEVLCEFTSNISQEELSKWEVIHWKSLMGDGGELLNIREPGHGGKMSEETKKKLSDYWMGKSKKPHTNDTKNKLRVINEGENHPQYGKPKSEETRRRISLAKGGKGQKEVECPHCQKVGGITNMKRYHFGKCPNKIN